MIAAVVWNIPCLACIGGAVYLIAALGSQSDGWGWLLLLACLLHISPRADSCDCEDEPEKREP